MAPWRRFLGVGLLSLAALRGQATALPEGLPAQAVAPVTDLAGMLGSEETGRLNNLLTKVWAQGQGPQVAVVTLPSLGGDSVEAVALAIARGWGLGDKDRDDGVLLLLSKSDRKLRIEVGTKFEGLLTDVVSHRIIADVMVPRLRAGDADGAVDAGVAHILNKIIPGQGPPPPPHPKSEKVPVRLVFWFVLILLWVGLPLVFRLMGFKQSSRNLGGGGWGGSGGGSWSSGWGGGFSGGGGGFSGGGSSGSW